MIRNVVFNSIHRILVMVLLCFDFDYQVKNDFKFFDVRNYGAIGDGRVDCTKAFMSCWNDVCKWKGKAQFLVPSGTYLVRQLQFSGPCLGPVDFHNAGVLKAHYDNGPDFWVMFKYIDNLAIFGGGSFDGQGPTRRFSKTVTPNYQNQVTSLSLDFVTNSRMDTMKFINSKDCSHIKVFACHDIRISHITISSPEHSPNTDGINIGNSKKIQVSDSYISSGDDCISILSGGQDINITGIYCGPGHGISIGSLGGRPNEPDVKGIIVRNCNFTNTLNGVRIKTWANNNAGNAAHISFENIFINNAYNPIIIDQHYCPSRHCQEGDSHIHISNVKFTNIRGISKSRCAVNFQCSKYKPCQIETRDIDLVYNGVEGPAVSSCSNVHGIASGCEKPPSCISKYVL